MRSLRSFSTQISLRSILIQALTLFIAMPILAASAPTSTDLVCDDGGPMVRVPAGEFIMGTDVGGHEDEKPLHRVSLSAFLIDTYEVTVSRYAKFLEVEDHDPPFLW
ncbi:MAG TPA: SUMF1/EgtB/PvdO family nonheme iron enzyme, partial [Acidobacteriaceae bacterium]|nr:SUMF1/EgtB/PvdO family nonheme iron enzyme [Acidobacteriaceae bacterium]